MKQGEFIGGFAPYGYKKSAENKNKLEIDPEASRIVKMIFEMAARGERPATIRDYLRKNEIPTPLAYRQHRFPPKHPQSPVAQYEWNAFTINKLLKNQMYLGHTVQGKTKKASFKSDKIITCHQSDWIVVRHTHEAIIDEKTFALIQKHAAKRTVKSKSKFTNIFSGLAKCAACGKSMSSTGTRKKESSYNLVCGTYKLYGCQKCTNHFISYDRLYALVWEDLKAHISLSAADLSEMSKAVQNRLQGEFQTEKRRDEKHLAALERRLHELDNIIRRLYEDRVFGRISEALFFNLLQQYEAEQAAAMETISSLRPRAKTKTGALKQKCPDPYHEAVQTYMKIDCLTADLLYALIDHIEIGQGYYDEQKNKHQEVKIYYRFAAPSSSTNFFLPFCTTALHHIP